MRNSRRRSRSRSSRSPKKLFPPDRPAETLKRDLARLPEGRGSTARRGHKCLATLRFEQVHDGVNVSMRRRSREHCCSQHTRMPIGAPAIRTSGVMPLWSFMDCSAGLVLRQPVRRPHVAGSGHGPATLTLLLRRRACLRDRNRGAQIPSHRRACRNVAATENGRKTGPDPSPLVPGPFVHTILFGTSFECPCEPHPGV